MKPPPPRRRLPIPPLRYRVYRGLRRLLWEACAALLVVYVVLYVVPYI